MYIKTWAEINNSIITSLPKGYITNELLDELPMVSEMNGSWGPLTWDIDYHIDPDDITKCYFRVKIELYGVNIVNTTIDSNNPQIDINLSISGVGITAVLGVDFQERLLYLRGDLNFIVYKKHFDLTLLKF